MPTGYTARLEEKNYDVKKWLKEDVIRNFGICAFLRDSGDLNEEQIKKEMLETSNNSYHELSLKKYNEELQKVLKYTEEDWEKEFLKKTTEVQVAYYKELKEYKEKKEKHRNALKELSLIEKQLGNQTELVSNALKFAYNQISEVLDWDYKEEVPTQDSVLEQNLQEYKKTYVDSLIRDIQYHTEALSKEVKYDRIGEYLKFVEVIDKL